ncbi:MAG: hypothetical protein KIT25_15020 [Enhydrobacter sp.]|nr:MAG: hypothetical protein KIT25_15020 [Enhydrobacter sp.]
MAARRWQVDQGHFREDDASTSILLRLPVTLHDRIKVAVDKRDIPDQSLIMTWLAEKTGSG